MIQENFQLEIDDAANGEIAFEKFKEALDKKCGCKNRGYKLIIMDL